ncbi:ArsR/SmtB family transcription factor [Listeria newyorkensis]|uniref:Winged helix-turn-helix transcriptional regulator n=1 Tax=Listeria newyorkensis TaxID=1497681 RepID=A0A841YUJ5_9LIST|nr:metalloregulator ArsR/SmtB family transcription factor [Listeria newyorkensis]MBC1456413.1 winged helix-turn-helix transcriptional regulator [Listeria newyorkensis]
MNYVENALFFKAISDSKRLQIVDMLSRGELCACDLLDYFDFTQPTLSHHMKILVSSGIVRSRRSGTWHYYSLDVATIAKMKTTLALLSANKDSCDCKNLSDT